MVQKTGMTALFLRSCVISGLFALVPVSFAAAQETPEAQRISQFSGKPVPRFESLRYSAVHGRQGPSLDHPIVWRYEKEGLPVLVVRETHGWRRVRDRDGDEVWVQARMLSADRRAIVITETVLHKKPRKDATPLAALQPGVVLALDACEADWCEVTIERRSGWVPKASLWGVETDTGGL